MITQPEDPKDGDRKRILEAVEERFDEIEDAALRSWNAEDQHSDEAVYTAGFLEGVKYIRREYRRTLSVAIFGK